MQTEGPSGFSIFMCAGDLAGLSNVADTLNIGRGGTW